MLLGPFTHIPPRLSSQGFGFLQKTELSCSVCGARSAEEANNMLGVNTRKASTGWCSSSWQGLNEITSLSSTQAASLMCCGNAGKKSGTNKMCQPIKHIRKKNGSSEVVFIWLYLEKSGSVRKKVKLMEMVGIRQKAFCNNKMKDLKEGKKKKKRRYKCKAKHSNAKGSNEKGERSVQHRCSY